jgi:hypothetical protein
MVCLRVRVVNGRITFLVSCCTVFGGNRGESVERVRMRSVPVQPVYYA